jgi:hypothetical protein
MKTKCGDSNHLVLGLNLQGYNSASLMTWEPGRPFVQLEKKMTWDVFHKSCVHGVKHRPHPNH